MHRCHEGFLKKISRWKSTFGGLCRVNQLLGKEYGWFKSRLKLSAMSKSGGPLPWYTYPAIDYLEQLDFSEKSVFEFGCGNSTLFWAVRCKQVTSVENDTIWFEKVNNSLPSNVAMCLRTDEANYSNAICELGHAPFVVVIDGLFRAACAASALAKIDPSGLIILDNSERGNWDVDTMEACRILASDERFLRVDFYGLGPINDYAWTTSCYVSRNFPSKVLKSQYPSIGAGAITG